MIQKKDIDKALQILQDAGRTKKVILFGSWARDEAEPESDVDFLVIQGTVSNRTAEMVRLRRLLSPLRIPVDVVVVSEAAFQEWSTTPGNIFYEAATEGKLLYEAA